MLDQLTAGATLLKGARLHTGEPYVYGGLDCSKLVQDGALYADIILPRTTEEQYKYFPLRASVRSEPGDLLFSAGDPIDANPGHVVIFVSPGVVHGVVFEAEMTGTRIGPFQYDTDDFEFRTRPALAHPMPQTIAKAGLTVVTPAQARIAQRDHWALRNWDGEHFPLASTNPSRTTTLYASVHFKRKR